MRDEVIHVKFHSLGKCDNPVEPCRISDNCRHHFFRLNGDLQLHAHQPFEESYLAEKRNKSKIILNQYVSIDSLIRTERNHPLTTVDTL
jgi:hypothetical protein